MSRREICVNLWNLWEIKLIIREIGEIRVEKIIYPWGEIIIRGEDESSVGEK